MLEKAYELEAIASTDGGDGMEPEKGGLRIRMRNS